jgi:hypothetical protein
MLFSLSFPLPNHKIGFFRALSLLFFEWQVEKEFIKVKKEHLCEWDSERVRLIPAFNLLSICFSS